MSSTSLTKIYDLDMKIREYLQYSNGLEGSLIVEKLIAEKKYDELEEIMMKRLTFGTAGLRGKMGPGYAAMNDLVIIQTSQGLAAYLDTIMKNYAMNSGSSLIIDGKDILKDLSMLQSSDGISAYTHTPVENDIPKRVVIGFDSRHNSERFAQLAAVSFVLRGYRVFLYSKIVPTPFIPYSVQKLCCLVGIMITASHNPKDDNGYKVYWSNGAQILPPHDENIQESILNNLQPWPNATDVSLVWTSPLVCDPLFEIPQLYFNDLKRCINSTSMPKKSLYASLKVTFTAMHGVSHAYIKKAFQILSFDNFVPVKAQMYPDPNFPTVVFPNPEENNCLDHSIATADEAGSSLILANDPDVDRLAIAEKLHNGKWKVYSGNEVGALLGWWLWENNSSDFKTKHPERNCMISSTVSSKILRSIAEVEGFTFIETLTGFKWMANMAIDWIKQGNRFIFAFEEAIGYMCTNMVFDKDGIHAAMQIFKMAAHCYSENKLLYDQLKTIYQKYGFHVSCNSYFICHDPAKITAMFTRLRNFDNIANEYPKSLKKYAVRGVRDLTTGFDSTQPDKNAILPCSSSTQMITFYFKNGCEATLRTSGTEPKVKYYTEIIRKVPESEWEAVKNELHEVVDLIISEWMQPEVNGFLPRPK